MNSKAYLVTGAVVFFTIASVMLHADLQDSGNGLVYDEKLDVTWLQDANLAASKSFGVSGIEEDGSMTWQTAREWIAALNAANYLGFDNWRLPTLEQPDPTCKRQQEHDGYPDQGLGHECTGSEMGHLHNVHGVTAESPGHFVNLQPASYWYGAEFAPNPEDAWYFVFATGYQGAGDAERLRFAWPVLPGDATGE